MYWAGRQGTGEQDQPERKEEGPVWGSMRAAAKGVSRAGLGAGTPRGLPVGGARRQAVGLGASFPYWLLASGFLNYLPHEFLHREVHIMAAGFHRSKQMREKAKAGKTEADSLCNIISEATSNHFLFYL